jgi:hypothetical protein
MLFPFLLANSQTDQLGCHHQIPDTSLAYHHVLVILLFLTEIYESCHQNEFPLVAQALPHALRQ